MPTCKKCNTYFSTVLRIAGKKHNVSNREHCLVCLPFKSPKRIPSIIGEIDCVCNSCGRNYKYNPSDRIGHQRTKCNSCVVNTRRKEVKARAILYLGGCCKTCGYNKCNASLEFHHIDPSQKEFQISNKLNCSWETLRKELDKCVLLCRNCHGELHQEE